MMMSRDAEGERDLVDEQLCAYQTLLDQEGVTTGDSSPAMRLPAEFQAEFKKLQRCLDVLNRCRGSWNSSPTIIDAPTKPGAYHVPSHIGRFPIREPLGNGGCGIVFLGVDPKINRQVAIKIPRPELLGSQELINRFLLEGRAVSQLEHPNILPVYESQSDGIVPYLVMPMLPAGRWQTGS